MMTCSRNNTRLAAQYSPASVDSSVVTNPSRSMLVPTYTFLTVSFALPSACPRSQSVRPTSSTSTRHRLVSASQPMPVKGILDALRKQTGDGWSILLDIVDPRWRQFCIVSPSTEPR